MTENILSEDYTTWVEKIKWNHDIPKEYLSSAVIMQLASTQNYAQMSSKKIIEAIVKME
ncbi:MAG: hypothetical protein J6U14_09795 [Bacteroidaceae bacterium]|nr:hypothetical protein [Bacteroidaceae bacterium]